ncbi:MAG: MFS transporter [Hyphomicrobiales bacterium]|nr:MAG: MFS transporter [Hyphomicrobiales bacterium]
MGWSQISAFILVATLLTMSPGPNGLLVAKTVPTSGKAAGFANVGGILTGFYLHGTLSILGISVILVKSATAFAIVKYLGAAYLCWIGLKALWAAYQGVEPAARVTGSDRRRTLGAAYLEGLMTNALNPKVSMFYLAAFPQFLTLETNTPGAAALLVFLHSAIAALWFGAMILLFSRLTRFASSGRFQRWLKGFTGIVFLGFGAKLATYRVAS